MHGIPQSCNMCFYLGRIWLEKNPALCTVAETNIVLSYIVCTCIYPHRLMGILYVVFFNFKYIRHWMKYVKLLQFIFIDCQKRHIGSNIATYAPFHYIFFLVVLSYKTFCPQIDNSIIECLKLCREVQVHSWEVQSVFNTLDSFK